MLKLLGYSLPCLLTIWACNSESPAPLDEAQMIVNQAIERHGGSHYENLNLQFDFRDKTYTAKIKGGLYEYTRAFQQGDSTIRDVLTNDHFTRQINGEIVSVVDIMAEKYANSINSVHYFAFLPYHLNDAAVNKKYVGSTQIKGESYEVIEVTFDRVGGGKDYDDIFYYWFHETKHTLDYLAYSYQVDGGGVRFRAAYNSSESGSIRFQDYVNFKAPIETPLADLPDLYEAGQLKELSKIELKNIKTGK